MSFEMSAFVIQLLLIAVLVLTTAIILATRWSLKRESESNLTKKNAGRKWRSPLEGRVKYPEVDLFNFRGSFLNYGFFIAVGLMVLAFSWTSRDEQIDISQYLGTLSDQIEMETPRTSEPPPPPPPPPQPTAMEIVASDLPEVETMVFQDRSIDEHSIVQAPVYQEKKEVVAPPPPPPPPIEDNEREIFKVVEQSPMFPGCEDIADKNERKICAETKMLQFMYGNIQYPAVARDNGVEGMVVIQFIVEKDGSITGAEIIRDIGANCGEEAKRVVNMMPLWNPGRQRDRPVRVQFTLPVKFILQ